MSMKMRWYRKLLVVCLLTGIIIGGFGIWERVKAEKKQEVSVKTIAGNVIIPGGMPIGIYMETDGVMVLGTEALEGTDGISHRPAEHLVKEGDYIVGMNDESVKNKRELTACVKKLSSEEAVLKIRRNEEILQVKMKPVQVGVREYKLGIWVRDNVQGLGTITFLTGNSEFGALGHGIHDVDTNQLLDITEGALYATSIKDIQKGESGMPGGMEGIIVYNHYNVLGKIEKNTENGIYGRLERIDTLFKNQTPMEICPKEAVESGKAQIRCAVDGSIRDYEIRILKTDLYSREANKGMVLEVTDPELLRLTGGIVQGMSGSPILQNGKIVGAVTHVLVNDPTRGYGIFIENMLEAAE